MRCWSRSNLFQLEPVLIVRRGRMPLSVDVCFRIESTYYTIRKGRLDFTDEPEDQRIMELATRDELLPNQNSDKDGGVKHWNSQAATIEIWTENAQEKTRMVELALRENRIDIRCDVLADGSRKIFVQPSDESRAREIVREIKNATPPG